MLNEPLTDRSENEHHVSPIVGRPQEGKDTPSEQSIDRKLESQEHTHQGLEQVEHSQRLKRHQPSGGIQNKEEVGLSQSGCSRRWMRQSGGWMGTTRPLVGIALDPSVGGGGMSSRPVPALGTPPVCNTIDNLGLRLSFLGRDAMPMAVSLA